jgi:hypothetical protein
VGSAGALQTGTVIEVSRVVDTDGNADLAGRKVKIGAELARGKVTLRLGTRAPIRHASRVVLTAVSRKHRSIIRTYGRT